MSLIRMVTDEVRQVARGLSLGAGELQDLPSNLKKLSNDLSVAWQGGNAEYYKNAINSIAGDLLGEIENLQYLSVRIDSEATEWEEVDSAFGGVVSEMKLFAGDQLQAMNIGTKFNGYIKKGETIAMGLGTVGVITSMSVGTTYAGQVIFSGGKTVKGLAGLSPNLTHIKAVNLPRHIASRGLGKLEFLEAGLDFGDKAINDWANYESGSEKAIALGVDAIFVAGKTFLKHHAAHIVTTMAVSALVTAGVPAVGVAAVGLAVWWGSSQATGFVLEKAYEWAETSGAKDSIVKAGGSLIDGIGRGIQNVARSVDRVFSPTIQRTISM